MDLRSMARRTLTIMTDVSGLCEIYLKLIEYVLTIWGKNEIMDISEVLETTIFRGRCVVLGCSPQKKKKKRLELEA
jgi:hypothetical protein